MSNKTKSTKLLTKSKISLYLKSALLGIILVCQNSCAINDKIGDNDKIVNGFHAIPKDAVKFAVSFKYDKNNFPKIMVLNFTNLKNKSIVFSLPTKFTLPVSNPDQKAFKGYTLILNFKSKNNIKGELIYLNIESIHQALNTNVTLMAGQSFQMELNIDDFYILRRDSGFTFSEFFKADNHTLDLKLLVGYVDIEKEVFEIFKEINTLKANIKVPSSWK